MSAYSCTCGAPHSFRCTCKKPLGDVVPQSTSIKRLCIDCVAEATQSQNWKEQFQERPEVWVGTFGDIRLSVPYDTYDPTYYTRVTSPDTSMWVYHSDPSAEVDDYGTVHMDDDMSVSTTPVELVHCPCQCTAKDLFKVIETHFDAVVRRDGVVTIPFELWCKTDFK